MGESHTCFNIVNFACIFSRKDLNTFGREAIPVKRGIRAKSHSPILEEDLRRLVGAIDNTPQGIRDYAIIMLLYATGVRVSELTALDVSDVDLNSQTIVVITRKRKDLVKRRQVPYTNETQLALVNWLSHKKRIGGNPALFLNFKDGGRLTVRSVQRIIKDYCRRSGLDNVRISPHSFRHGLGMRCAESQMYPPYLQDLLGHTNLNSSKVYYNLKNPSLIKEYHERVGDSSIAKFLTTVNEKNKLGENVKK